MSSQEGCSKGWELGYPVGSAGRTRADWLKGRTSPARPMLHGAIVALAASLLGSCTSPPADPPHAHTDAGCRVIRADVVAIEQAYVLNRFAAFVPAGMMYALRHDVVAAESGAPAGARQRHAAA